MAEPDKAVITCPICARQKKVPTDRLKEAPLLPQLVGTLANPMLRFRCVSCEERARVREAQLECGSVFIAAVCDGCGTGTVFEILIDGRRPDKVIKCQKC